MFKKIRKKVISLTNIIILFILILNSGCVSKTDTKSLDTSTSSPVSTDSDLYNLYGNSNGNLANDGLVMQKNDWIYYITLSASGSYTDLYKIKKDGTDKTKLSADLGNTHSISIKEDWIYFTRSGHNVNL